MEFTIEYPPMLARFCTIAFVTAAVAGLTSSAVMGAIIGVGTAIAITPQE